MPADEPHAADGFERPLYPAPGPQKSTDPPPGFYPPGYDPRVDDAARAFQERLQAMLRGAQAGATPVGGPLGVKPVMQRVQEVLDLMQPILEKAVANGKLDIHIDPHMPGLFPNGIDIALNLPK